MKKHQITLTVILILLCLDVVLLIMDRKARAEMEEKGSVAAEQKPSIQDVAKSVRAMLNDDLEEEENSSPQAERRQQRRKVREERAYTLMALDALRMRIVKEAKQKALQGRNVCGPYLDMVNGHNNMLRNMVGEESNKMAPRVVKLNTPLFRAGMAEHKELMLKKREQINEFMHHLDTSRFDDATAMAHADYVAALDELRALYDDPSASYEAKLAAQSKADNLANNFGSLLKTNNLDQGFNQEKQKNELYVSALNELLCLVRFQAEINKPESNYNPNKQDDGQYLKTTPEDMIRFNP